MTCHLFSSTCNIKSPRREVPLINQFQVTGTISKPPHYFDASETPFITFSIKVKRNYHSKNDKPIYDFLSCKAFGATATYIHEVCKEEDHVAITGQIQTRRFEYQGERRYATELVVSQLEYFPL